MNSEKVAKFMELAGINSLRDLSSCTPELRKLGAQLLLSETLEYVIKGLGVIPSVNGEPIRQPDALEYQVEAESVCNPLEMLDGLADVAYTMYWNAVAFDLPLEQGFDLVCDNNLEKFVPLEAELGTASELQTSEWHCGKGVQWPAEVVRVRTQKVRDRWYAVGTDKNGKVRKPSTYVAVDLRPLLRDNAA